jgi:hypothetical protein
VYTSDGILLDPGEHVVLVEATGHAPITRRITVVAGMRLPVDIALAALATSGRLLIEAEPSHASIEVDGIVVSHGRLDEVVGIGEHQVRVAALGFAPFERRVVVTRAGRVSLRAELDDVRPVTSRTWFQVVMGVGGAAVVAGAIAGVVYLLSGPSEPFTGALYDIRPMGL